MGGLISSLVAHGEQESGETMIMPGKERPSRSFLSRSESKTGRDLVCNMSDAKVAGR